MTEPLELLVIEGQKQGARAPVSQSAITSVGNDYDCDVMLGLPGIEHALALPNSDNQNSDNQTKEPIDYPKMEMKQIEGRLYLRVVRGNIQVGQETLGEGGQSELQPDTPVTLGKSVFVVGPSSMLQTVDGKPPAQQDPSQSREVATADSQAVNAMAQVSEGEPKKRRFGLMHAAAALCVLVGGAVIAFVNYSGQSNNVVQSDDVTTIIAAELEGGGFTGLTVSALENDLIMVNGYLESRAELYEARNLLQTTINADIEWDVQLGETLVDSVQSVFQVNGVVATVEPVSNGSVLVQTSSDDLALLERIEKVAYADVADLKHLELVNAVPVVAEVEEPENNSLDSIPGKRIVMIMPGEYILTEDGSVYYTGSVLPSGHKVVAILDEKIQVELNDSQIELTY